MRQQDYDAAKVGLIGAAGTAAVAQGVQEALAGAMSDYADQVNQGARPIPEIHMAIFCLGWYLAILPLASLRVESLFQTNSVLAAIGTLVALWLLIAFLHVKIDPLLRQGLVFEGVAMNGVPPFIANATVAHYYPTTGFLAHLGIWIVARGVINEVFTRIEGLRRIRHGIMTFMIGITLIATYIAMPVRLWMGYHPG